MGIIPAWFIAPDENLSGAALQIVVEHRGGKARRIFSDRRRTLIMRRVLLTCERSKHEHAKSIKLDVP